MNASPYDLNALAIERAKERIRQGKKPKRESPYTLSVDCSVELMEKYRKLYQR